MKSSYLQKTPRQGYLYRIGELFSSVTDSISFNTIMPEIPIIYDLKSVSRKTVLFKIRENIYEYISFKMKNRKF